MKKMGQIISKIQVIPKRAHSPTFNGTIYVVNDSWRISAVNLSITKKNGMELIDTLNVKQQLVQVGNVFVPQSIQFSIAGKLLGFQFSGYVLGVFKNYDIKPTFNKNFFTKEILKVEKTSNRKRSLVLGKTSFGTVNGRRI
jgi:hypothetical protein